MERSPKVLPNRQLALRFIAGKYKGGELLLDEGQEIVVGRVGDVDLVLDEDMVSRRHARIACEQGRITIEDLASTNGTFVNGEKVAHEILKEGDRILIGTNILKVVSTDPATSTAAPKVEEVPVPSIFEETRAVPPSMQELAAAAPSLTRPDELPSSVRPRGPSGPTASARSMSGAIHEFPLPYLLQLLESSQKTGVLVVRSEEEEVAKIYLRKGLVVFATMNDSEDVPPRKVVFRVLTWARGTFDLEPPEDRTFPVELSATMQELLMEGLRQIDELNHIRPKLPDFDARLVFVRPLVAKLRDLSPFELDIVQLALNFGVLSVILNKSSATDFDTAKTVLKLLDAGYLRVG